MSWVHESQGSHSFSDRTASPRPTCLVYKQATMRSWCTRVALPMPACLLPWLYIVRTDMKFSGDYEGLLESRLRDMTDLSEQRSGARRRVSLLREAREGGRCLQLHGSLRGPHGFEFQEGGSVRELDGNDVSGRRLTCLRKNRLFPRRLAGRSNRLAMSRNPPSHRLRRMGVAGPERCWRRRTASSDCQYPWRS